MQETIEEILETAGQYFKSDLAQAIIFLFKIISGFFSSLLFLILLILLYQLRGRIKKSLKIVSESIGSPGLPKKKMAKKWENILKQIRQGSENDYRFAVIEADKSFDEILKKIGYQGKDMGERMKNIKAGQISNLDQLWQAHKMRNNIVHDPDFRITRAQAEEAVKIFEKTLKELQAI